MNSRITDFAQYTNKLLCNLGCDTENRELLGLKNNLENAITKLKGLKWDQLLATEDEKRQELTIHQQEVIKSYTELKRELLIIYRDIFQEIKGL